MFDRKNFLERVQASVGILYKKLLRFLVFRIRVLSVVIFCASVLLTVKAGQIWYALRNQETGIGVASSFAGSAEEEDGNPAGKIQSKKQDDAGAEVLAREKAGSPTPDVGKSLQTHSETNVSGTSAAKSDQALLPSLDEIETEMMTPGQYQILEELSNSTDGVGNSKKSLPAGKATLEAIESRLDEKIEALKKSETELKAALGKIEEKDRVNNDRLVKMMESMKPEEAAKILETLELPILLELMESIKPAKGGAILAVMEANKAGYLMNELAKRKRIIKAQPDQEATKAP